MNIQEQSQIRQLIENGQLKEALKAFNSFAQSQSVLKDQVSNLTSRFYRIKEHEINGTLNIDEIQLEKNKITKSILELLEDRIDSPKDRFQKSKFGKKALIAILFGLVALFVFWFFFNYQNKVIKGKVYTEGFEKAIDSCFVKIVNLSGDASGYTDSQGNFYIHAKGKKIQNLEFRLIHPNYEVKSEQVSISF